MANVGDCDELDDEQDIKIPIVKDLNSNFGLFSRKPTNCEEVVKN